MVKVIGHKTTSPLQTDGSPSHIHQCALPCGHIGTTWRIQLNLSFLLPTQVHNTNGKSIGSAVFAQLMSECCRAHWCHLANMIEIVHTGVTWRIWLNLCFLWLTRVHNPKGRLIGSAISAQLTAVSPYTLQWATLSPKIAPHLTLFLAPIQTHNPNVISIGSAVFAQMTAECSSTWQWDALSRPQNCHFPLGIWTPSGT